MITRDAAERVISAIEENEALKVALRQRDERIEQLQAELDALRSAAHAGSDDLAGEVLTLRAALKPFVDYWFEEDAPVPDFPEYQRAMEAMSAPASAKG